MKIALIGATGNIGSKILKEATDRGLDVVAITRNPDKIPAGPRVQPVGADLHHVDALAAAIRGVDAVVVSVDWAKNDVDKVLDACRKAGVSRVLTVGGAASLNVEGGGLLFDSPNFPEFLKPIVRPALEGLQRMRGVKDLEWTFVSPSMTIEPGERTGKFRLGTDTLLSDEKGVSRISQEDFAIAVIDEVEHPQHVRQRFTVGY